MPDNDDNDDIENIENIDESIDAETLKSYKALCKRIRRISNGTVMLDAMLIIIFIAALMIPSTSYITSLMLSAMLVWSILRLIVTWRDRSESLDFISGKLDIARLNGEAYHVKKPNDVGELWVATHIQAKTFLSVPKRITRIRGKGTTVEEAIYDCEKRMK